MAASVVSGVRCLLRRASYRSGYLTLRYTDIIRHCTGSSQSTGDSTSDSNGEDAENKTLPGSAIRAKKTAAVKEEEQVKQESAQQTLDEKLTSAVDNIAKSMPMQHQSNIRSELLQKLLGHSHSDATRGSSASFTSVFSGMRIDNSVSKTRLDASKLTPREEMHRTQHARHPRRPSSTQEIVPGVTQLFQGPSLGIFSSGQKPEDDTHEVKSTLFDKLEAEELKHLMTLPPSNAFEEMIQWTEEGKLWTFPIDNEQGMDEEAKVGFHEHIFLEQLIDDRFPASGPIRHFMELVVVGLSKSPYLTVAEKHAHIAWYAEYFKEKYEIIERSQTAAAAAGDGGELEQSTTDAATNRAVD